LIRRRPIHYRALRACALAVVFGRSYFDLKFCGLFAFKFQSQAWP